MSRSLFQSTLPGWGATDRGQAGDDRNGISIHAPRMGSDLALGSPNTGVTYFNPRSPDGERHLRVLRVFHPCHFNPRSPDGERLGSAHVSIFPQIFQSTLPGWGATGRSQSAMSLIQISIHAPRIGSDKFDCVVASGPAWISIHAPRMGSDRPSCEKRPLYEISIHAPRMGSDEGMTTPCSPRPRFQSTLPGWGATPDRTVPGFPAGYFNPRSPDGERLMQNHLISSDFVISIHAPRMGSDRVNWYDDYHDVVFQSTLPGWGATVANHIENLCVIISIHAPRMGSDTRGRARQVWATDFNPRSPDGERQVNLGRIVTGGEFQSTLPGWGATIIPCGFSYHGAISIHAPRMGSDRITADSG